MRKQRQVVYSDKLKDPRWQKTRLKILERDEWACVVCGDTESQLHVHHTYYESGREPWEYDWCTLETVCGACHRTVDALRIESMKSAGSLGAEQRFALLRITESLQRMSGGDQVMLLDRIGDLVSEHVKAAECPEYCPRLEIVVQADEVGPQRGVVDAGQGGGGTGAASAIGHRP